MAGWAVLAEGLAAREAGVAGTERVEEEVIEEVMRDEGAEGALTPRTHC